MIYPGNSEYGWFIIPLSFERFSQFLHSYAFEKGAWTGLITGAPPTTLEALIAETETYIMAEDDGFANETVCLNRPACLLKAIGCSYRTCQHSVRIESVKMTGFDPYTTQVYTYTNCLGYTYKWYKDENGRGMFGFSSKTQSAIDYVRKIVGADYATICNFRQPDSTPWKTGWAWVSVEEKEV